MPVLRHICQLTNDTPWQCEEYSLYKTEQELRYYGKIDENEIPIFS